MSKSRLLICNSGGKTSAYMTKRIIDERKDDYEIEVVFANTGQENEETLDFVNNCDQVFGFRTTWLEAVVNPIMRKATTHKIVTYETATRDGSLFDAMIQKYGIPNKSYPHCTRELKERPIHSYAESLGWKKGEYETAIGIRCDEPRRIRKTKDYQIIIYPLIDWFPTDKIDVNDYWADQLFNLDLAEHKGNCKWCWKKSLKKHIMLIKEAPEIFNVPAEMEKRYPHAGHNDGERARVFFRENRSTKDLFALADNLEVRPTLVVRDDESSGCTESCEPFMLD